MHGSAQWHAVVAVAVAVACYLLSRRGRTGAVVAVLCTAEVAATGAVAAGHDVALWLVDQVAVVFAVFVALAGAYLRLRHALTVRGWDLAQNAELRERARIAADIHDTLGHDLTLLSLQAAGLQVTAAEPEIREQAAAMRAAAATAIARVRRLVDLLSVEPDADTAAVIDRARAAGMTVEVSGALPRDGFTARLLSEALSNAAAHAPGEPVTVRLSSGGHLEVRNPLPGQVGGDEEQTIRKGTGLKVLSARLTRAGGSLDTTAADGYFWLTAEVPPEIDRHAGVPQPLEADFDRQRRRARTALVLTVLAPLVALVVLSTGFYAWAAHGTTIEPATWRQLHMGMSRADALALLPARQSPIRFGDDHGPDCRRYTDGNYPLAYATYEICFRSGAVSWLADDTGGAGRSG